MPNENSSSRFFLIIGLWFAALLIFCLIASTWYEIKEANRLSVPPISTLPQNKGIQTSSGYAEWASHSSGGNRGRKLEVVRRKEVVIHVACPSDSSDEGFILRVPEGIRYEIPSNGNGIVFSRPGEDRYLILENTRYDDLQRFEWELSILGFGNGYPESAIRLTASQQKPLTSEEIQRQLDAFSDQSSRKE